MPFAEDAALDVTALRAIESTDRAAALWTDADRDWASRAAAETVGATAAPEDFLATRARLALDRLGERFRPLRRAVAALRWRPWVGGAVVGAAFVAGVAIDQVGGGQRINLLAPPLFGLLLWNLAVYTALALGFVVRYGDAAQPGPLRRLLARIAGGRARPGRGDLAEAVGRFAADWARLSAPLYSARTARILHVAAALFAAGVVAGLYLRGIAFEYRASWESTFLAAANVRALLAAALAPGALVTGIPVPSLAEVEAIRAPAAENAGRWLHLMAATVALAVILPRLALALAAGLVERYRATRLPLALDEPYFARLLRGFRGGPVRVQVVPYSYTPPAAAAAGLDRLLRQVFGANAGLTILAPVPYGGEDALAATIAADPQAQVIALFNASATAERAAHGALLAALRARLPAGGTLLALVDDSAFRDRAGGDPDRLQERRDAWRQLCADGGIPCAFATLASADPDVTAEAAAALEQALAETVR